MLSCVTNGWISTRTMPSPYLSPSPCFLNLSQRLEVLESTLIGGWMDKWMNEWRTSDSFGMLPCGSEFHLLWNTDVFFSRCLSETSVTCLLPSFQFTLFRELWQERNIKIPLRSPEYYLPKHVQFQAFTVKIFLRVPWITSVIIGPPTYCFLTLLLSISINQFWGTEKVLGMGLFTWLNFSGKVLFAFLLPFVIAIQDIWRQIIVQKYVKL